jgi:hypothetical protein
MAPVLLKVLEFLRIIRIATKRFPGRRGSSLLLALLGRKLKQWWRFWLGKFGRPKPAVRPFRGTEASSYSVSDASAVVSEYVVAASHVPASASRSSLTQGQPATLGVHLPVPAISVDPPHVHHPLHPLDGRGILNRSTGNLSIQSRASDRLSIITNSRESSRPPPGQPSRLPRGTHRQFGRGPDPSRSRERATRPTTPATRPNTPHRPLSIRTNLSSPAPGDGRVSPVVQSPASSYTHEPRSALSMHERGRTRRQSTMTAVDVEYPSTDSLPTSSSTNPPQITDEPLAIDPLTARSSPDFPAVNLPIEPGSPTSSNPSTLVPEGRFVQLINSDQIPRYEKNATVQVGYTFPS